MRIGVDIRSLTEGRRTGVEEYTINLLRHIFNLDKENQYRLFSNSFKWPRLDFSQFEQENISTYFSRWPNKLFNLSLKTLSQPSLDKFIKGADVFFAPNINLIATSKNCPKIVTFHDLSFEKEPQFFSLKRRLWHKFINPKKQAQEASAVIAVSDSTKEDLVNFYKINPDKIRVIYSGIDERFKPLASDHPDLAEVREKYNLPDKFILYLGTIEPRKNIVGLIKAFEALKEKNYQIKLVIAGIKGWLCQDVFKAAKFSPHTSDIIFTGFVEDKDKPLIYNLADVFVYPSFYEGFGFPPLEAMACAVPTITSNCSSLPEAVSEGAVMIDPYNIDELSWALETVLTDDSLRKDLKEKGRLRAKNFSWFKCASQTLDLLKESR